MAARAVADSVREPEQDDDEDRKQQQRRRVVRQPRREAHDAVPRPRGAGDDRQAEHEQRVREQGAEDRGLGDNDLAGREREEDDEELRQVAERRLEDARQRGAEARADGLGRERRSSQASPASAAAATQEHSTGSASA